MSENHILSAQNPTDSNETSKQPPSDTAQTSHAAGLNESVVQMDENSPPVEAAMPKNPESTAKRAFFFLIFLFTENGIFF